MTATPLRPAGTSIRVVMDPSSDARGPARSTLIGSTLTHPPRRGYDGRHDALRRGRRGRPPARGPAGHAVRLRQPGPDRPARRRRRTHVAVRRRRRRVARRPGAPAGDRAATVARRADRHGHHGARRGRRDATSATTSPSSPARARSSRSPSCCGPGDLPAGDGRGRTPIPTTSSWPSKIAAAIGVNDVGTMVAVAGGLGARHAADDPPTAARRLLGVAPIVLRLRPRAGHPAGRQRGDAPRCGLAPGPDARSWPASSTGRSCCSPTTSWRRRRSPCASPGSTWPGPYLAFAAGLATVAGHRTTAVRRPRRTTCSSSASAPAGPPRSSCAGCRPARSCPASATRSTSATTRASRRCSRSSPSSPIPHGRIDVVHDLLAETGVRMTKRPNVDLGLGGADVRRRSAGRHPAVRRRPHRRLRRPPPGGDGASARCATAASPARAADAARPGSLDRSRDQEPGPQSARDGVSVRSAAGMA